jgi:hypothetical protein
VGSRVAREVERLVGDEIWLRAAVRRLR